MTDGKAFPGRRGVGQAAGASVGFRGAALNQSHSASGVYTGLRLVQYARFYSGCKKKRSTKERCYLI
ncbi:MAG: hypothetical protein EOM46_24020 [Gammaproteobacteria bacterium]|nr:hypothetical protein [Gammaproteobacteria bacterium]